MEGGDGHGGRDEGRDEGRDVRGREVEEVEEDDDEEEKGDGPRRKLEASEESLAKQ